MNLEMITEGLKQLLQENNYSSATIRFYEGEWNKIQCFLTEEYGGISQCGWRNKSLFRVEPPNQRFC